MEENLPPLDGSEDLGSAPPREGPPVQHLVPPGSPTPRAGAKKTRKKISLRLKPAKKPATAADGEEPAQQTAKCYELATTVMSLLDVLGAVEGGKALTECTRASTGAAAEGNDIYAMIDSEVNRRGLDRSRESGLGLGSRS